MRIGLLSDVHGNLQALETVLDRVEAEGPELLACLGDVVGYGGDPEACLDLVRERVGACVMGNHDAAVVDPRVRRSFNSVARIAIDAHADWLDPADVAWLAELPAALNVTAGADLLLTHGTPGEEAAFTYLTEPAQAARAFRSFRERYAAVGHTHVPALWEQEAGGRGRARGRPFRAEPGDPDAEEVLEVAFEPGTRAIVNPGSVGQPRDGDPRAAFVVLDLAAGAARLHRVPYDVAGAQGAIRRRRLPEVLAARLALGR